MTRALLIEDEPESLQNLQNLLEKYCPDVDVISTGGSIADLLRLASDERDNHFDVAFLDINLPDGLVFQGLQQLDEIPFDIIFVSALPIIPTLQIIPLSAISGASMMGSRISIRMRYAPI